MRQRRLMNQINVVPYIDVMLVLLVIFMVTAPMIQTGSVDLPNVSDTKAPPPAAAYVIVHKDASYSLQRSASATPEKMKATDLQRELVAMLKANAQQSVVIAADKNVQYDRVMSTLDQLRKAGFSRVSLQTESGPSR